ncbi:hypothetical protein CBF45_10475 [Bordetella sp. J329]|uniref:Uncharacterized protein n=1 Tax=Kerstersia gyiorum TaxID=206506 RepID=A0A171KS58_9BURK|nr:hypothetical protein CBF45_10475 [Bordetella sp. J329]KKO71725.1 hypothetical protein AAV32_08995 [Kerstersia gyiorum]
MNDFPGVCNPARSCRPPGGLRAASRGAGSRAGRAMPRLRLAHALLHGNDGALGLEFFHPGKRRVFSLFSENLP